MPAHVALLSLVCAALIGAVLRPPVAAWRRHVALGRRVSLLTAVLADSSMAFAVHDTKLRFVYVNDTMAAIFGRTAGEMLGKRFTEVIDDADRLLPSLRETLETGTTQINTDHLIRQHGKTIRVLVSRYPVHGSRGAVIGVASTYLDIADQWRIASLESEARQLRARAELVARYEAAQQISALGTWEYDVATGERTWSQQMCEITGTSPSLNSERADLLEYVHPDDRQQLRDAYERLLGHTEPFRLHTRLRRSDGQTLHTVVTGQAVKDEAGAVARVWGTMQDVTERRAMETARLDALRAARQARADLAAGHAALQMLQRAMLPAAVPTVPGAELAVAYQPIVNDADIGGDWYDAFLLPDGRLAVTIGDVAGHDLRAASAMAQVRNALRAYAVTDPSPGRVLQRVNALLMSQLEPDLATAVYGVYDPASGLLTFSRAGHPPPLVRHGRLPSEPAEPAGIALGAVALLQPYTEQTVSLRPGDSMLLYTDGLVERRGHDASAAVRRLRTLVDALPPETTAAGFVAAVTTAMIDPVAVEDDVCLLVLHRTDAAVAGKTDADGARKTDADGAGETAAAVSGSGPVPTGGRPLDADRDRPGVPSNPPG